MTGGDLAQRCADVMFARDRASQMMGMTVDEVTPGYARLSMSILPEMLNGHGIAHGGAIFALADSAFAFACNSRNVATVAQHCAISYIAPVRSGQRLTAEAREVNLSGRFGVYDVTVRGETGETIAVFRGHSAAVRGTVLTGNGEA